MHIHANNMHVHINQLYFPRAKRNIWIGTLDSEDEAAFTSGEFLCSPF